MNTARDALHAAQQAVYDSPARFKVVACGRRWGKTELGKRIAIEAAQQGKTVWWISPNYGVSLDVWRSLKASLIDLWESKNEQQKMIVLPDGGAIRVRSGDDPDSLRGASLDLAVLDEAAFLRESIWTAAIRPTLSDRRGRALFLSTPNGIGNWFYRVYTFGLDPTRPEWQAWRFPTRTNPHIPPDEIDTAQRDVPDRIFRAEYLAEFTDDAGGVFRGVLAAATLDASAETILLPDHRYVMGVDWGRVDDFTVGTVLDATDRVLVALDRFNGVGWELQRGRLRALADRWQPVMIYAENNSIGSPNIEALQADGLPVYPFNTTNASKDELINDLALAIERGQVRLLNDPILINELSSYMQERTASGRFRYGAPPGGHDDTVIALALAWHAAQHGAPVMRFG
jgi:hypothetical protein